ncbi:hypothetical protein [Bacillus phage vB_BanS-Thrax1]|nr:hypothetical protein [Bacillus phage vB_BanS-Thrax1]
MERCTSCGGSGTRIDYMYDGDGNMTPIVLPCTSCGGTGKRR